MAHKKYHAGNHPRLAAQVTAAADANPEYRCPLCGLTKAQGIKAYGHTAGQWDAGHRRAGQVAASVDDYEAQHAHCNRSKDANRTRYRKHSRQW